MTADSRPRPAMPPRSRSRARVPPGIPLAAAPGGQRQSLRAAATQPQRGLPPGDPPQPAAGRALGTVAARRPPGSSPAVHLPPRPRAGWSAAGRPVTVRAG
jgi:hypothetical protein